MSTRFAIIAALAAALVVTSACGSSTSDDPASGGSAGSGASSGSGGSGGGSGADAGTSCPTDFSAAEGTTCSVEGKYCNSGCSDPCQFCNVLHCEGGKWVRMEAFPDPNCGDAGDAGDAADAADASDAADATGPDASDGGSDCGGKQGLTCKKDEYCDYKDDCGAGDSLGTCKKRPQGCTADCPGVCGCDGKFHCNACGAAAQGVDVTGDTSCMKDGGGPGAGCSLDKECNTGLKCCYPCGQQGCSNQCMQPMSNGQCPQFP